MFGIKYLPLIPPEYLYQLVRQSRRCEGPIHFNWKTIKLERYWSEQRLLSEERRKETGDWHIMKKCHLEINECESRATYLSGESFKSGGDKTTERTPRTNRGAKGVYWKIDPSLLEANFLSHLL